MSSCSQNEADRIISDLCKKNIKLLAIDFDHTLITIHTGGMWKQGAERLREHVRPCLKRLIEVASDTPLSICIVTYSLQPWLIRELLALLLPRSNSKNIIVRGNTPDWMKKGLGSLGKEEHIASVLTELYNRHHLIIHPNEILLLDDDTENIEIAQKFGHHACLVSSDFSLHQLEQFVSKL